MGKRLKTYAVVITRVQMEQVNAPNEAEAYRQAETLFLNPDDPSTKDVSNWHVKEVR